MSDMGPSLRDLAKFAGLAVALSKQTLVDALVQFFPESFSEGFFVKLRRPYNTA